MDAKPVAPAMMAPFVRPVEPGDKKWVSRLWAANMEWLHGSPNVELYRHFLPPASPGDWWLVIPEIAFVHFRVHTSQPTARLYELVVDQSARQQGIGRLLLRMALKVSGDRTMTLLTRPDNQPAIALYSAEGFVPVAQLGKRLIMSRYA
jgi:ribosomal protein S18 acetylase RimI-like enzyme